MTSNGRKGTALRVENDPSGTIDVAKPRTMVLLRKIAAHQTMATGFRITVGAVVRKLVELEAERLGLKESP